MSDNVSQYKCPACGGAMEFDSATQKMKCPYCDTVMDVSSFDTPQDAAEADNASSPADAATTSEEATQPSCGSCWGSDETEDIHVYVCESCGGEILADDSTGATTCPFCGNRVVMKGQFSGDLRPDFIIPFKKNKKGAKEAYKAHISNKPFVPDVFSVENHIDEIKGIYVPFWLFNLLMQSDVNYTANDSSSYEVGNKRYIDTSYYKGNIGGTVAFEHVAEDASSKMDDALMESIEPFDFKDAVPFKPAYLAGYLADRYDVPLNDRMERAKERASETAETCLKDQVHSHEMVTANSSQSNCLNASYLYALYPVWVLTTTWRNEHYVFAMNGQTGRTVGNLPLDKRKFWLYVATRALGIGAIAALIFNFFIL